VAGGREAGGPSGGVPGAADAPESGGGYFRIDVTEVSLTYLGEPADHLVIESWNPAQGYRRRVRR